MKVKVKVKLHNHVWRFATPWTVALQAPLSVGILQTQEYWRGLPFISPGDHPYSGLKPGSPTLQADSLPSESPGRTQVNYNPPQFIYSFAHSLLNNTLSTYTIIWNDNPHTQE